MEKYNPCWNFTLPLITELLRLHLLLDTLGFLSLSLHLCSLTPSQLFKDWCLLTSSMIKHILEIYCFHKVIKHWSQWKKSNHHPVFHSVMLHINIFFSTGKQAVSQEIETHYRFFNSAADWRNNVYSWGSNLPFWVSWKILGLYTKLWCVVHTADKWERSFPLFCDCKTELMEVLQNVLPKPLQHWTPKDSWTLSYFCTLFCMRHSWAVPLVSQPKSVEVVSFVAAVLWERWKEDTKEREFRD